MVLDRFQRDGNWVTAQSQNHKRIGQKLTIVGVFVGQVDLEFLERLKRIGSVVPGVVARLHERGMLLGVFWVEACI